MNFIDNCGIANYEDFKIHIYITEERTLKIILDAVTENKEYYNKLIKELRLDLKNYGMVKE